MPWKSARDNVAIGLEVRGRGPRRSPAGAQVWLERVGLRAFGDRYPHQLSGGQRKRVGLAQVLIRDPKFLMDEPFGPLDAQTRQIMGNLLLELWAGDRKAVLFVTHDLEEAIALSDRVVIMSAGPARASSATSHRPTRPRDASEVRLIPRFHELHKAIWSELAGVKACAAEEWQRLAEPALMLLRRQALVAAVAIAVWYSSSVPIGGAYFRSSSSRRRATWRRA